MASKSPRNKMLEMHRLESVVDLFSALDRLNELIQHMQGSFISFTLISAKERKKRQIKCL